MTILDLLGKTLYLEDTNGNFKRKCAGYLWKFKEERKGE